MGDRIAARRDPFRPLVWGASLVLFLAAAALGSGRLPESMAWAAVPFLTLAAVLAVAAVVELLGVFRWLAAALVPERSRWPSTFVGVLAFTALVSGLVNLDVAVVVAMPVAIGSARRLGGDAARVAVAVAITANAASILLPTSNLTTLLVLSGSRMGVGAYLRNSWAAWVAVVGSTIGLLTLVLARPGPAAAPGKGDVGAMLRAVPDLVPMFLAASAVRAIIGNVVLGGSFPGLTVRASLLAAMVNNLPAAAATRVAAGSPPWAAILGMAIGPNLVLTGSVATVICRRIAREAGTNLPALTFSLVGLVLVPVQLLLALACST